MRWAILILVLAGLSAAAQAQTTRYVSDQLIISLRSGPAEDKKLIRTIPSGTPLVVLDEPAAGDFVHVRDGEGTEGWVLSRFLMDQPAARDRLGELTQRLEKLKSDEARHLELIKRLSAEKKAVEHTLSAGTAGLEAEVRQLRQENRRLADGAHRQWFLAGAGVLGGGLLVGLILPRLRTSRRRDSW